MVPVEAIIPAAMVGGFIGGIIGYKLGRSDQRLAQMERENDEAFTRITEQLASKRTPND